MHESFIEFKKLKENRNSLNCHQIIIDSLNETWNDVGESCFVQLPRLQSMITWQSYIIKLLKRNPKHIVLIDNTLGLLALQCACFSWALINTAKSWFPKECYLRILTATQEYILSGFHILNPSIILLYILIDFLIVHFLKISCKISFMRYSYSPNLFISSTQKKKLNYLIINKCKWAVVFGLQTQQYYRKKKQSIFTSKFWIEKTGCFMIKFDMVKIILYVKYVCSYIIKWVTGWFICAERYSLNRNGLKFDFWSIPRNYGPNVQNSRSKKKKL